MISTWYLRIRDFMEEKRLFDISRWSVEDTILHKSYGKDGYTLPIDAVLVHKDNEDEMLRYQLRSLYYNTPWIRHVFILTKDSIPKWAKPSEEGITFISYDNITEIQNPDEYQLFINLYQVKNLAGAFIYLGSTGLINKSIGSDILYSVKRELKITNEITEDLIPIITSKRFLNNNSKELSKYTKDKKEFIKKYNTLIMKYLEENTKSKTIRKDNNAKDFKFNMNEFTPDEKRNLKFFNVVSGLTEYPDTKKYKRNTCSLYDNLRQFVDKNTWKLDIDKLVEYLEKKWGRKLTDIDRSDLINILSGVNVDPKTLFMISKRYSKNCFYHNEEDKIRSTIYGRVLLKDTLAYDIIRSSNDDNSDDDRNQCNERMLHQNERMIDLNKNIVQNIINNIDIPKCDNVEDKSLKDLTIASIINNSPRLLAILSEDVCNSDETIDIRDGYRFIGEKQISNSEYDGNLEAKEQHKGTSYVIKISDFNKYNKNENEIIRKNFRKYLILNSVVSCSAEVSIEMEGDGNNDKNSIYRHSGSITGEMEMKNYWWKKLFTVLGISGTIGFFVGLRVRNHFVALVERRDGKEE